jgi:hypothetical protein
MGTLPTSGGSLLLVLLSDLHLRWVGFYRVESFSGGLCFVWPVVILRLIPNGGQVVFLNSTCSDKCGSTGANALRLISHSGCQRT